MIGLLNIASSLAWLAWLVPLFWGWFVTPVTGVPAPGWATCVGLCLLVDLVTLRVDTSDTAEPNDTEAFLKLVYRNVCCAVLLGLGYATHLFQ